MNAQDVVAALNVIGLVGQIDKTNHPDWERVFMYKRRPGEIDLSLGRCTIYKGQYYGSKWYGNMVSVAIKESTFYKYAWQYYLITGNRMSQEEWDQAVLMAHASAQELYDSKRMWREANPRGLQETGKHKGRQKHRAKLAPPNPHRFLRIWLFGEHYVFI